MNNKYVEILEVIMQIALMLFVCLIFCFSISSNCRDSYYLQIVWTDSCLCFFGIFAYLTIRKIVSNEKGDKLNKGFRKSIKVFLVKMCLVSVAISSIIFYFAFGLEFVLMAIAYWTGAGLLLYLSVRSIYQ